MAAASASEIHLLKAILCNKRSLVLATGVLTVYDDNGTDVLLTLTPTESGGVVTRTPVRAATIPDAADPGAELHLALCVLANKVEHEIASKDDTVYEDDGSTPAIAFEESTAAGVVTVEEA